MGLNFLFLLILNGRRDCKLHHNSDGREPLTHQRCPHFAVETSEDKKNHQRKHLHTFKVLIQHMTEVGFT